MVGELNADRVLLLSLGKQKVVRKAQMRRLLKTILHTPLSMLAIFPMR
jgi:hypothetical protein